MHLRVQANFLVQRLILSQALSDVSYLDAQVELLEGECVEIEFALLCLKMLLGDSLSKELTRVQELLEQKACQLAHDLLTLGVDIL